MKRWALAIIVPALLIAPLIALLHYLWAILFNPERAVRIAVGFDQLANVAANGSSTETISSRAYRAQQEGRRWGCVLCRLLDKIDKDHCRNSAA